MSDPIIRAAAAGDLSAIERIVASAYGHYVARIGKQPGPMLDDYAARIRRHEAWVLVDGHEIAGLLVLIAEADHLLLDNVAVDPERQGRGVGRRLMGFAEQEARRRGYGEVRLYTHAMMHENVAMYPRLGYRETGRGEQDGYARVFFCKRVG